MESPGMLSPGSTTQVKNGGGPAHKSGSRAPSSHSHSRPRRAKGAPRSRQAPAPAIRSLRVAHRRGGRLAALLRKKNFEKNSGLKEITIAFLLVTWRPICFLLVLERASYKKEIYECR